MYPFLLYISLLLILLGVTHLAGTLIDEQIITINPFLGIILLMVLISLFILLTKYKLYKGFACLGLLFVFIGGGVAYYDHSLLLSRGFPAFGFLIPTFLIFGGTLLMISSFKEIWKR